MIITKILQLGSPLFALFPFTLARGYRRRWLLQNQLSSSNLLKYALVPSLIAHVAQQFHLLDAEKKLQLELMRQGLIGRN